MNLWTFGGSYIQRHHSVPRKQWMDTVAKELNATINDYSLNGSSLDYTYVKFNEIEHQIQEYDVIITMLTPIARKWFFHDRPNLSFYPWIMPNQATEDERKAVKYYELYLNNNIVAETNLKNFLYKLNHITHKLWLHTIIIPEDITTGDYSCLNFAQGSLLTISEQEPTREFLKLYNMNPDFRINHMTKSNHDILAKKIIDNIKYQTPIDLTTDFKKDIITVDNLRDFHFRWNELFSVDWGIPSL